MPDFTDQPVAVQPGQISADVLVAEVLRDAAKHCDTIIDTLPQLIDEGRISPVAAQQADRFLIALAEMFREPLVAQGETLPQSIR